LAEVSNKIRVMCVRHTHEARCHRIGRGNMFRSWVPAVDKQQPVTQTSLKMLC